MKSTHNTAHAYGKSVIATLCMVTGTAFIMAACSTAKPPATWQHNDGSTVIGTQIAIAPGMNAGVMQNVTYIQRVNTKSGQDITKACSAADVGDKLTLPCQADYIFWKAM